MTCAARERCADGGGGKEVATRERTRRSRAERAREWGVENR